MLGWSPREITINPDGSERPYMSAVIFRYYLRHPEECRANWDRPIVRVPYNKEPTNG